MIFLPLFISFNLGSQAFVKIFNNNMTTFDNITLPFDKYMEDVMKFINNAPRDLKLELLEKLTKDLQEMRTTGFSDTQIAINEEWKVKHAKRWEKKEQDEQDEIAYAIYMAECMEEIPEMFEKVDGLEEQRKIVAEDEEDGLEEWIKIVDENNAILEQLRNARKANNEERKAKHAKEQEKKEQDEIAYAIYMAECMEEIPEMFEEVDGLDEWRQVLMENGYVLTSY